jgi:hypothetical protein
VVAVQILTPSQRNLLHNHPRSGMLPTSVFEKRLQKAAQTALSKTMDADP